MKTDPVTAVVIPALPILTARDVYSNASPLLTGTGKMSTMFSLMEGQVHSHQLYLENVGTVPIHQLRMTLSLVVENKTNTINTKEGFTLRTVEVDVFASDQNAPGTPARKQSITLQGSSSSGSKSKNKYKKTENDPNEDEDLCQVFVWNKEMLNNLRKSLPLLPGQICTLSLAVDARRGVPSANLMLSYAMDADATHTRCLNVPFALTMEPALNVKNIDVQFFDTSVPENVMTLMSQSTCSMNGDMAYDKRCSEKDATATASLTGTRDSMDTNVSLVILEVENPTSHPFEVTCRFRTIIHDEEGEEGEEGKDENDADDADDADDESGETQSNVLPQQMHESMFVSTFEGNSIQHLVVPVQRDAFRDCDCNDPKSCLRVLDALLDIYWKSSQGTIGSISLLGRGSGVTLTSKMVRKLLPPSIRLSCRIVRGNSSSNSSNGRSNGKSNGSSNDSNDGGNKKRTTTTTTRRTTRTRKNDISYSPSKTPLRTPIRSNYSKEQGIKLLPPSFMKNSYPSPIPIYQKQSFTENNHSSQSNIRTTAEPFSSVVTVGETVTLRVVIRNIKSYSQTFTVKLVPYIERGDHVVVLDKALNSFNQESGSVIWSGSLSRTIEDLEPNEEISHVIEICVLLPGEYKFAVTGCNQEVQCWSSHPLVVNAVEI